MEELEASELGTQEYWNERYKEEIQNFNNHGDPGEIWFGEDIVDRVISWINRSNNVSKEAKIIDIGCGNGMFLIDLSREGYHNLCGVDYSESAVKLAKSIAETQNVSVDYAACNILEGLEDSYDIIHDKGTYDAISLRPDAKESRQTYMNHVHNGLKDNGLFIITSCNWTLSELDESFKNYFERFDVIPTPQFKFGGKVGNVVTSAVYKKVTK